MNKSVKSVLALVIALVMAIGCLGTGIAETEEAPATYTYHSYATSLGSKWNPHDWDTSADDAILGYITTPFVAMSIDDSENGVYQWIYEMATEVNDVTATHQADLTKYAVNLPEGQTAEETTEGFVYEIKLREGACWQDGTPINADTYIYSMQQLLNPDMKNYRANLYYSGESAVAGGSAYYYSKDAGMYQSLSAQGYASIAAAVEAGADVKINAIDFWNAAGYTDAEGNEIPDYISITDETVYDTANAWTTGTAEDAFSAAELIAKYAAYLEVGGSYADNMVSWVDNANMGASFDVVGCYKVDDYTIIYVNESKIDRNYFLTSLTSNWLVYEPLYEAGKTTSGELVSTNYGTSFETTMSYGPYYISSLQEDKQIVYTQNPNWYGYQQQEDGSLVSYTSFEGFLVDGEDVQQYKTTSVVVDVMSDAAAKQAFLKGELSTWAPEADDLITYSTSEQLYKVDETYTMSLFFDCGLEALKEMDNSKGNTNSVVLSNINFRKGMSLAIDRSEFVTATAGYKPAFGMLNNLYYYDAYNNPNSQYRSTDAARKALCETYNVEYGEGTPYATLKEAADSITGYNLTEAKELMKTACEELVAAGLYTAGDPIVIRIAWMKGALQSSDQKCGELLTKYVNAAIEGSGFGTVTFEQVDNIPNRYDAVANGEYAIGYGSWGGAAFYPFRNFQVYCDPDQYSINEAGCWDPTTETATFIVEGNEVTKTWQAWSGCMVGSGDLANLSFEAKLEVLSQMEAAYMQKYYRIQLCGSTDCSMLSYQLGYYTDEYNIMYDFGGLRLMDYYYTDAEWAEYVASEGGVIAYE